MIKKISYYLESICLNLLINKSRAETFAYSEKDCVLVNGYFPSLTLKSILNTISEDILEIEATFTSNTEQIETILG